jgi:hypothetical protein
MRGLTKGLLIAACAVALGAPAAIAAAGESQPVRPIIGGVDATETYTFMAHLKSSDGWGCGAALIRPTWIATARHCVTRDDGSASPASTLSFRVGTKQENSGGTVVGAKRVLRYESGADFAIVELANSVSHQPVNIAKSAPVGSPIRIIGWGCIKDPGCEGPDVLQQLDTSILADSACGGGANYLCINNPDGWRGACYGDSGGPAVLKSGTSWILAGTTSGGTSAICGQGPSVYNELPTMRTWIESYAGPDGGGDPGAPSGNLALNKATKSNQASCNANEGPAKAVNGSVSGGNSDKWCSTAAGAKSLEVDLGATESIKKFTLKHAGAGGESAAFNTRNFTLEISTGGGIWSTVATVTSNTAATTDHAVSANARWIRVTTTDAVARIYEFEAYS